ncbi:MAG TPA: DUF2330 domain-containing protein [Thermoanaerobaculia bacterium]|nr:DUF2330 domain-containing protein [Thermoanaerobaculia bacterium]
MRGPLDEIVLAIGALLIALSARMFYSTRALIARCRTADGRVTHYNTEEDPDSGVPFYYARVRFRDASGIEHETRGSSGLREPPTVGAPVRVTYDLSYPSNAWITGSSLPWVLPWLVLILGLTAVVIGLLLPTSEASACAPAPRMGERVNVAEEAAVIVWDPASKTEHFIRRATFTGEAREFGFLVPTPTVPVLARVDDGVFDRMHGLTTRRTEYAIEKKIDWTPLLFLPFASRHKGETMVGSRAPVEVLSTQKVAGYDAAILDATDATALSRWLADNGYATTPDLAQWLDVYVAQRWIISAFKIDKSADAITARTSAVRMSFATSEPFFPYREPASQREGASEPRVLKVWFIGPERVTGRVAGQAWTGQLFWSEAFRDLEAGGVKIAGGQRLTAFEDHATPRPGVADLYFVRDRDQDQRVPPPIVETQIETTHVPADVVLALPAMIALVWWRRRRRP